MSNIATQLAWALVHPRTRRPVPRPDCEGSRAALAGGCRHADDTAICPTCGGDVAATPEPSMPRVIRLAPHPEMNR